jgi:hypothetical protein
MKNNSPLKPDLKKITKILNLMSRFDAPCSHGHPASLSSESGESLRHVGCYSIIKRPFGDAPPYTPRSG